MHVHLYSIYTSIIIVIIIESLSMCSNIKMHISFMHKCKHIYIYTYVECANAIHTTCNVSTVKYHV